MTQKVLLLADDHEDNLMIYSAILTHHGYGVLLAADGREAVELARGHAPRLIVMDLQMPVMDGWEATRLLRSDPATGHIPVIAVTAAHHPATHFREAGFCAYVPKPVAPQDLLSVVELCLEKVSEATPWVECPDFDVAPPDPA